MADYVHFSMPDTVRIMRDQQNRSHSCLDVPYIANYIYENPTSLDLSLKGFWISDRECLLSELSSDAELHSPSIYRMGRNSGTTAGRQLCTQVRKCLRVQVRYF